MCCLLGKGGHAREESISMLYCLYGKNQSTEKRKKLQNSDIHVPFPRFAIASYQRRNKIEKGEEGGGITLGDQ